MFVFTVAILICHYVCRCMRLVTALAQRQANVAETLGDILIQRLNLLLLSLPTACQFGSLGSNLLVGCNPFTLESLIPVAHFRPTLKCCHLNLRWLGVVILVNISFFLFFPRLVFVYAFEACELPRINPT